MQIRLCILFFFWIFSLTSAVAQDNERTLTYTDAVALLAKNNPTLLLSKTKADEQAGWARQASAFPNPSLSVSHEPLYKEDETTTESYININQRLEWPGLRKARINTSRRLYESAVRSYQADSLQVLYDMTEAYIEASSAEKLYQQTQHITAIFREAARAATEQYKIGEMSGYQMRRLNIEQARYENRLAQVELDVHRLQRRLGAMILPDEAGSRIVPATDLAMNDFLLSLDAALEQAYSGRPELKAIRANVEAAGYSITAIQKSLIPTPTITAGVKRQSDGFNGLFGGAAIDLPIFDRKKGALEAGNAQLHQAQTQQILIQQQVDQDVRQAYEVYISIKNRKSLVADELLAESAELLEAAQTSYEEGEISLVELLDASDAFYEAQQATIKLHASLQIAYFDLMRATGHIIID